MLNEWGIPIILKGLEVIKWERWVLNRDIKVLVVKEGNKAVSWEEICKTTIISPGFIKHCREFKLQRTILSDIYPNNPN